LAAPWGAKNSRSNIWLIRSIKSRQVRDIQSALAAIDDGTYGTCEQCEEPIPRKRLDAVPWARMCVPCQSKAEAASDHGAWDLSDAA
jgi:DnaK suppressor protein